jgi:hypothetical protein
MISRAGPASIFSTHLARQNEIVACAAGVDVARTVRFGHAQPFSQAERPFLQTIPIVPGVLQMNASRVSALGGQSGAWSVTAGFIGRNTGCSENRRSRFA